MEYQSGEVYEGQWKEDRRCGKGATRFQNGDLYEGEYQEDKREGMGELICKNGGRYKGEFKEDKPVGEIEVMAEEEKGERQMSVVSYEPEKEKIFKIERGDGSVYEGPLD